MPIRNGHSKILNFESKSCKSLGVVKIDLNFEHFELLNRTAFVFENLSCDLILGANIFKKLEISRNPYHTEILLNGYYFPCGHSKPEIIRANSDITISANSFKFIEFDRRVPNNTCYFSDPILRNPDVQLEPVLAKDKIILGFTNLRPFDVVIRKDTPLAEISPF